MEAWNELKKKKCSRRMSQNSETLETEIQHVKSDVFYNLVPINYVSRVCGLLPMKFMQNKLDHTTYGQTDFPLLAYGVTLALALTGGQCWGLYRELHDDWQNCITLISKMRIAVISSDVLITIILAFFVMLDSLSRWKTVLYAFHKIAQADEQLNFTTKKNLARSSIILITCTLISVVCMSVWDYIVLDIQSSGEIDDSKGPINYCPFYLMQMVIMVLLMQYAVILMILGERFTKINSTIEELTKTNATIDYFRNDMGLATRDPQRATSPTSASVNQSRQRRYIKVEGVISGSDMIEPIDQLIKIYDLLCDSIIYINKAFGMQLLISTFSCLVHLVVMFYFIWFELNDLNRRWYMAVDQMGWIAFHTYKMFLFVQPPHMVASKARDTGSLISQALASNWNPRAQKQLESFAMQLLHRPVEFTACGLFHLDRGLIASVAGVVTTYLMILVQFRSNNNNYTSLLLQNESVLVNNISGVRNS